MVSMQELGLKRLGVKVEGCYPLSWNEERDKEGVIRGPRWNACVHARRVDYATLYWTTGPIPSPRREPPSLGRHHFSHDMSTASQ